MDVNIKVDGESALASGSIVVGPDREASLVFGPKTLIFKFASDDSKVIKVVISQEEHVATCTFYNADGGSATDLLGILIDGRPVVFHIAVMTIGTTRPHRIVHYTVSYSADA